MTCPQCGATIDSIAVTCPRCGQVLQSASAYAYAFEATTIALTPEQVNWFRANAVLPVVFIGSMLIFNTALFSCVLAPLIQQTIVQVFAGLGVLLELVVTGLVGLHIYNNIADLRLGVAQVRVARLIRKHSTSQSPRTFYAEFEQLGRVIVMYETYQTLKEGLTYKVSYSPRTRKGWSVEEYGVEKMH